MSTSESARIIAKNLKNIAFMREKSQSDIARALNINKQTVSSWMTGRSIPRIAPRIKGFVPFAFPLFSSCLFSRRFSLNNHKAHSASLSIRSWIAFQMNLFCAAVPFSEVFSFYLPAVDI